MAEEVSQEDLIVLSRALLRMCAPRSTAPTDVGASGSAGEGGGAGGPAWMSQYRCDTVLRCQACRRIYSLSGLSHHHMLSFSLILAPPISLSHTHAHTLSLTLTLSRLLALSLTHSLSHFLSLSLAVSLVLYLRLYLQNST
jgi:hypothetical protein